MSAAQGLLALAVGVVLRFDGADWIVEEIQAEHGRVLVRSGTGARELRMIGWLMRHPDCRVVAGPIVEEPRSASPGRPVAWTDLTREQQEAEGLNAIGTLLLETGQPLSALARFTEAVELAREVNSQHQRARALEGVGRCRIALGTPDIAVVQLREAVEIYRRLGAAEADAAAAYLATVDPGPRSHP